MGIYYDDKAVQAKADGTELEKLFYEGMKEVEALFKEKGGVLILRKDSEKIWDKDKISFKPAVPFSLPLSIPLYLESMGAVSIRYSEASPQRSGKLVTYPRNRKFIYDALLIKPTEKDLAWFIIKVSNFVKQNESDSGFLYLEDPEKELGLKADEVRSVAKVDMLLMNEDSLLYNMEAIKFFADKFAIDIKDYRLETASFIVREAIMAAEKTKNPDFNISVFLKAAEKYQKGISKKKEKELEDIEIPDGGFTIEELGQMEQVKLNQVSRKYGTKYPPHCKKPEQISLIMEKQEELNSQE